MNGLFFFTCNSTTVPTGLTRKTKLLRLIDSRLISPSRGANNTKKSSYYFLILHALKHKLKIFLSLLFLLFVSQSSMAIRN